MSSVLGRNFEIKLTNGDLEDLLQEISPYVLRNRKQNTHTKKKQVSICTRCRTGMKRTQGYHDYSKYGNASSAEKCQSNIILTEMR